MKLLGVQKAQKHQVLPPTGLALRHQELPLAPGYGKLHQAMWRLDMPHLDMPLLAAIPHQVKSSFCVLRAHIFIYIYVLILGQLLLISNGLCLITRHFINQEKSLGWNSQDRKRFVVFSMSIISSFLGSCWFWREVSPVLSSSVFTMTAVAFKHDLDLLTFFPLHYAQWNN